MAGEDKLDDNDDPKVLTGTSTTTKERTATNDLSSYVPETGLKHHPQTGDEGNTKPCSSFSRSRNTSGTTATKTNINNSNMVEFCLEPIQDKLTCNLCGGFFRDPYTVLNCRHTFCKSCLFFAVGQGHYHCPTCQTYLGQDVHKLALPDRVLENIIDKVLFPSMAVEDAALERNFYEECGIKRKPEYAVIEGHQPTTTTQLSQSATTTAGTSKKRKRSTSRPSSSSSATKNKKGTTSKSNDPAGTNAASASLVMVQLDPVVEKQEEENEQKAAKARIPPLKLPLLQTNGSIRIGQLKKYLALKLPIQIHDPSSSLQSPSSAQPMAAAAATTTATSRIVEDPSMELEILLDGVPLGNELSVNFVIRAVWMGETAEPLKLNYRFSSSRS